MSDELFWGYYPLLPNLTVTEKDDKPSVVYDHTGQPYAKHKPPLGFIDPNNLPKK